MKLVAEAIVVDTANQLAFKEASGRRHARRLVIDDPFELLEGEAPTVTEFRCRLTLRLPSDLLVVMCVFFLVIPRSADTEVFTIGHLVPELEFSKGTFFSCSRAVIALLIEVHGFDIVLERLPLTLWIDGTAENELQGLIPLLLARMSQGVTILRGS